MKAVAEHFTLVGMQSPCNVEGIEHVQNLRYSWGLTT